MSRAGARSGRGHALAAGALLSASLVARWPGVVMYDSLSQYEQAVSGDYADWHPPIMARLWALLLHVAAGAAPMLLLQMAAWWGGFGLLAVALARAGRARAGALVLATGCWPLFLGWSTVVLKDAQMACALVAATGLVGWWRLGGRAVPRWGAALVVLLVAYATLVRGNALFATVPFALALVGWGGVRGLWARAGLALAGMVAVIAASPVVNRGLLGAAPSLVERSLPLYDLAGITHHAALTAPPGLPPALWARSERRGCYTAYFWNPYGEELQCGYVGDAVAFRSVAGDHVMRHWVEALLGHPLAYARHRLAHLNSNLRFLVGPDEPDAVPPVDSERNGEGLGAPARWQGRWLVIAAGAIVKTPLGWPVVWLAWSAGLLWAARAGSGTEPRVALGRALALSATTMGASFAVVSIASDLRYHLWSMVAAALATILLADAGVLPWRRLRGPVGLLAAVVIAAITARATLPPPFVYGAPPLWPAH